ncbi:Hypothetical predicted protein [Octopus vulgaris]|uniref:Uncharacterized protein n=1 Tax=Octopus vulgaris TaxID=6645 RepID=A0AA36AKM8_OCTVU|nr:Hypothetical predicted protein [Octopus vulgaris]
MPIEVASHKEKVPVIHQQGCQQEGVIKSVALSISGFGAGAGDVGDGGVNAGGCGNNSSGSHTDIGNASMNMADGNFIYSD